jgi:hypothetical protein
MTFTSPSGLNSSSRYYFKVSKNYSSSYTEYHIDTGSGVVTYQDVAVLMNTAIQGAGFSAEVVSDPLTGYDIRVTDVLDEGLDSRVRLAHSDTLPDLFSNLSGFINFDEPVNTKVELEIYFRASGIMYLKSTNVFIYVGSGRAFTFGGAASTMNFVEVAVGGAHLSGHFPFTIHVTYIAHGSAFALSGAAFSWVYLFVPIGGITLSGHSSSIKSVNFYATGGIVLSGHPAISMHFAYMSAYKIILGGTSSSKLDVVYVGTNGIVLSGHSTTSMHFSYTASYKAVLSGHSQFEISSIYSSSGAIHISGTSAKHFGVVYFASGGALTFGGAAFSWSYPFVPVGGITLSGASLTQFYVDVGEPPYDPENPPPPPEYGTKMMYLSGSATCSNIRNFVYVASGIAFGLGNSAYQLVGLGYEAPIFGGVLTSGIAITSCEV